MKPAAIETNRVIDTHPLMRRVALSAAVGGWLVLLASPFAGMITLAAFPYSFLLAGGLGIFATLLCLIFGMPLYPEQRRPWLLPKLISIPLAILGGFVGIHFIPRL